MKEHARKIAQGLSKLTSLVGTIVLCVIVWGGLILFWIIVSSVVGGLATLLLCVLWTDCSPKIQLVVFIIFSLLAALKFVGGSGSYSGTTITHGKTIHYNKPNFRMPWHKR